MISLYNILTSWNLYSTGITQVNRKKINTLTLDNKKKEGAKYTMMEDDLTLDSEHTMQYIDHES